MFWYKIFKMKLNFFLNDSVKLLKGKAVITSQEKSLQYTYIFMKTWCSDWVWGTWTEAPRALIDKNRNTVQSKERSEQAELLDWTLRRKTQRRQRRGGGAVWGRGGAWGQRGGARRRREWQGGRPLMPQTPDTTSENIHRFKTGKHHTVQHDPKNITHMLTAQH